MKKQELIKTIKYLAREASQNYPHEEMVELQQELEETQEQILVIQKELTEEGNEVEKEPLYRARLKVVTNEFTASYLRTQSSDAVDRLKALEIGSKYIDEDYRHLSEFTEDELRVIGIWDNDQWEIEEVEE